MTGVLDEATETWVDLDAMFAAELPPCEVRRGTSTEMSPACGRTPSVAVLTLWCTTCPPRRRTACAPHVAELWRAVVQFGRLSCGLCDGQHCVTVGGLL